MYLIIHEDGELERADSLDSWLESWEAGLIDIVRFDRDDIFKLKEGQEWVQI